MVRLVCFWWVVCEVAYEAGRGPTYQLRIRGSEDMENTHLWAERSYPKPKRESVPGREKIYQMVC